MFLYKNTIPTSITFNVLTDMQEVMDSFPYYVILVDENHNIVMVNNKVNILTGKKHDEIIGKYCPKVIHGIEHPFPGCPLEEAVKKSCSVEKEIYDPISKRWISSCIYITNCITKDGLKIYLHIVQDITEKKEALEELNQSYIKLKKAYNFKLLNAKLKILSNKDHLTGLFNRRSLLKMLELEKNRSIRNKKPFTLIMADIDYFKKINDSYGHDAGDKILIKVSKELIKSIRKSDILYRWGGDEFLIFLPETGQSGGTDLANKLLEIFRKKVFKYSNNKINLTMSLGVFEYTENKNLNECLKSADNFLIKAKETGRDRVVTIESYIQD